MSVLKPRNRLVNFRLSEEEFESMKAACAKSGARSVSDFARGAVLRAMAEAERGLAIGGETTPAALERLDQTVAALEGRVEQLLRLLEGVQASAQPSPAPAELTHSE
jgi:hypothetical protein